MQMKPNGKVILKNNEFSCHTIDLKVKSHIIGLHPRLARPVSLAEDLQRTNENIRDFS